MQEGDVFEYPCDIPELIVIYVHVVPSVIKMMITNIICQLLKDIQFNNKCRVNYIWCEIPGNSNGNCSPVWKM